MPESVSFGSAIYCLLLHLWLNYEISYEMGDPNCIGFCRSGQKAWRNQPFFSGSSRSRTKKTRPVGGRPPPWYYHERKKIFLTQAEKTPEPLPHPYTVPVTSENGRSTHMGDQRPGSDPTVLCHMGQTRRFFYPCTTHRKVRPRRGSNPGRQAGGATEPASQSGLAAVRE